MNEVRVLVVYQYRPHAVKYFKDGNFEEFHKDIVWKDNFPTTATCVYTGYKINYRVLHCYDIHDAYKIGGCNFQHVNFINGKYDSDVLEYIESRRRRNI